VQALEHAILMFAFVVMTERSMLHAKCLEGLPLDAVT
jgi:hypothetical protein